MSKNRLPVIIAACAIVIIAVIVITNSSKPARSPQTYTLTIDINPPGTGFVSQPSGQHYEEGTVITLNGTPAPGYEFAYWQGDVSSLESSITIPMDSNKNVVAQFEAVSNPPIQVALDFFGVKNTHWISQVGGDPKARIQLVVLVRDKQGNLETFTLPPAGVEGFYMDFFQIIALKDYMNPIIFTGTPTGSLAISVAAYNVNKGPITKAQIDFFSTWTGTDWSVLKYLVPDQELVGSCWYTWTASENFGVGSNYMLDDGNLKVWLRIGSGQSMPDPVAGPVLEPNVEIAGKLPTNARARTQFYYNEKPFTFTLTNHESFEFPIYWRVETDSNPGTTINFISYPTENWVSVPGGSSTTITYKYWFTTPGDYEWKYVAEYPKGNPIASWEGRLTVTR